MFWYGPERKLFSYSSDLFQPWSFCSQWELISMSWFNYCTVSGNQNNLVYTVIQSPFLRQTFPTIIKKSVTVNTSNAICVTFYRNINMYTTITCKHKLMFEYWVYILMHFSIRWMQIIWSALYNQFKGVSAICLIYV